MPIRGRGAFPKPDSSFRDRQDGLITEYRALKSLPKSDEALSLLRRVGAIVRPIMQKHKWHLPLLVEMFPKNVNLLGLNYNKGQKIALRLRRAYDQTAFIDEESVVETMLHELTHNVRGPHDDVFFRQLDILTQEWYDVRANKKQIESFTAEGRVLGGVGGGGGMSAPTRRQEAAARAAERRRTIAVGCPSHDASATLQASQEQEQQERLHGIDVIVIDDQEKSDDDDDDDDDDEDVIVLNVKRAHVQKPAVSPSRPQWTCQVCTLLNPLHAQQCAACSSVRPGAAFWTCRRCQHVMNGGFADLWCCSQCGTVKIA